MTLPSATKAQAGNKVSVKVRAYAESAWITGCMVGGVVAQILRNVSG